MKRAFLIILCILTSAASKAQVKKDYHFIKSGHNRLIFGADSTSFLRLFKKMDRISAGANEQIRIVHIGGSHVQAGVWSGSFLQDLQSRFALAGGGYFVFPYRIGRTNAQPFATSFSSSSWKLCRPVGRDFCQPLGVCALNLYTADSSGYFGVQLTDKAACKFVNRVRVYHGFNSSYDFFPQMKDSLKFNRRDVPKEGYSEFIFDMPLDSITFSFARKDTVSSLFYLFGVSMENDLAPGFYLAALGANGASTASFLKAEKFTEQLPALNADLFILSLGVNDTQGKGYDKDEYLENYDTLITRLREASPDAAILLTTTTDNYIRRKNPNRRTISAREAMLQLTKTHPVAVWDLYSLMGGYKSMTLWLKAGLAAKDRVHFNSRGYTLVGSLMSDALLAAYSRNRQNP